MSKSLVNTIEEILTPTLASLGYEIVDVEIASENGRRILRIFIDFIWNPNDTASETDRKTITLDDCEKASVAIGEVLDRTTTVDFLNMPYVLEVSSPGITRPLKKPKDFLRFKGKMVKVSVFEPINGSRNFIGTILNFENDVLTLKLSADFLSTLNKEKSSATETASFALKSIARARLEPEIKI